MECNFPTSGSRPTVVVRVIYKHVASTVGIFYADVSLPSPSNLSAFVVYSNKQTHALPIYTVFQKNFTLFVFAITYSNVNRHLTIYFRQGSVETHIRYGGQYICRIDGNLLRCYYVKNCGYQLTFD